MALLIFKIILYHSYCLNAYWNVYYIWQQDSRHTKLIFIFD